LLRGRVARQEREERQERPATPSPLTLRLPEGLWGEERRETKELSAILTATIGVAIDGTL